MRSAIEQNNAPVASIRILAQENGWSVAVAVPTAQYGGQPALYIFHRENNQEKIMFGPNSNLSGFAAQMARAKVPISVQLAAFGQSANSRSFYGLLNLQRSGLNQATISRIRKLLTTSIDFTGQIYAFDSDVTTTSANDGTITYAGTIFIDNRKYKMSVAIGIDLQTYVMQATVTLSDANGENAKTIYSGSAQ